MSHKWCFLRGGGGISRGQPLVCSQLGRLAPVVVEVAGLPVVILLSVRVLGVLLARSYCTCVKDYFDWGRVLIFNYRSGLFKGLLMGL